MQKSEREEAQIKNCYIFFQNLPPKETTFFFPQNLKPKSFSVSRKLEDPKYIPQREGWRRREKGRKKRERENARISKALMSYHGLGVALHQTMLLLLCLDLFLLAPVDIFVVGVVSNDMAAQVRHSKHRLLLLDRLGEIRSIPSIDCTNF